MAPNRMLYLMHRRLASVKIYAVPADNIQVDNNGIITNLQLVGPTGMGGNLDGLTVGPDGKLYFSAYSATGVSAAQANGLYRFDPGPKTTDFVGKFAGYSVPGGPNSFYTDLTFDPLSGDLVGSGYDPSGRLALYRIPASQALSGTQQTFAWQYFFAGPQQPLAHWDGIAFDPTNGDLYLSRDSYGVFLYDRATGTQLGPVAGTAGMALGWDLAYQVRGCAETQPVRALCVPGQPGQFNVTFEVTNHSAGAVHSLALADPVPPTVTVSPHLLTGAPLPLGTNASGLFTVLVQGAASGQTVCLRGALSGGKGPDCENCCGIQTCVHLPECGCLQVYADSPPHCVHGNSGSFQYSFQVQNLGSSPIDHLFLTPASGGTLSPTYVAVPSIPANGGIDPTPRTITVSGASPGQPFCFDISAHDAAFTSCCQKRVCIDVPFCGDGDARTQRPATTSPVPGTERPDQP